MSTRGKLIMFDGPDGVGKTIQLELAAKALREAGHDVFTTHMLGGTAIGETLRAVMFSDAARPAATNLYLALAIYSALAEKVAAERAAGRLVLVDRSPLSLVAYQVYGDGFDQAAGLEACDRALDMFKPDRLIVYQAPLDVLHSRRETQQRHKASDYFEGQQLDYHERTAKGYEAVAARYQTTLIDAIGSVEAVHAATMQVIDALLG